jgi:ATP-dependent DNA ligase
VRLLSRNDLSLNGRFPEIVTALETEPVTDIVLDGEIVAFDGARTSFARLQQRGERPAPVFFYVFDILRVAGEDVTESRCARVVHIQRRRALDDHLHLPAPSRSPDTRRPDARSLDSRSTL